MKKSMKFLIAALALAALTTPAFALEHEVSGRFASFYEVSNYTDANSLEGNLQKSAPTSNWFDQRLRLGYNVKADANVKLVTKFELDYTFWGNSSYATGRNQGGAIGADSVNLETKNIYLDWTVPSHNLNAKVGMQGYGDAFSGIIFSSDMAGILLSHGCTNATTSVGFFRWNDSLNSGSFPGKDTQDLFVVDATYNINKDLKVGAAYYYIQDDTTAGVDAKVHTLGVNANAGLGKVNVNAFLLGQTGDYDATTYAKGYAAKLAANTAVGTGTLRADVLYVAGGDNQLYVTGDLVGYYDNEMMILSRDKNQTTIDNALVYDLNNRGEGVMMASLGFDQPFSSTLTGSANVGFASVADNVNKKGRDTIGTEFNVEVVKKATDNINLSARAAYVVLGDRDSALDADNPYAVMTMIDYKF
ncbi:MAG: porin [Deltaproteobacteria bacterium HGW-Deltaproteobacteria-4]|nr:MAG: porin [Deltaproteobacteria bacterium HGW-Deltaproteobacteria-4]